MCTATNDFHPPTGLDKFKQIPTVVFIRAARRVKLGRCFIVGVGQGSFKNWSVGLGYIPRSLPTLCPVCLWNVVRCWSLPLSNPCPTSWEVP